MGGYATLVQGRSGSFEYITFVPEHMQIQFLPGNFCGGFRCSASDSVIAGVHVAATPRASYADTAASPRVTHVRTRGNGEFDITLTHPHTHQLQQARALAPQSLHDRRIKG